ncbi:MAG: choice-of-anchor D domain-containing protein [Saccharothrix sp.]|nr:choice-of-anchor D domain-containing protein [Saccharothrix sp.]
MRTFRGAGASTAALLIATTLVGTAPTASAAEPPAAPYTAFSANFAGWGTIDGNFSYEALRTRLEVYQQTSNGYALTMRGFTDNHWHNFSVSPPVGTRFEENRSYPTVSSFAPTDTTVLDISGDGQGCDGSGTLNVHQATYEADTDRLAAFSADYSMTCGSATRVATGEIRFQSSVGYRATDSREYQLPMAEQPVGGLGTPVAIPVEVNGTLPTTFGEASLSGEDPTAFKITANTCSGNTLSYGQTCTVTITPLATAVGRQTALLTLLEDSVAGKVTRLLSLYGFDPRDAIPSPGSVSFGSVPAYDTSAPRTVTLTGSGTLPITFGQATIKGENAGAFRVTQDSCAAKALANGQQCTVTVVARPTAATGVGATLSLPDDSVAGATDIPLSVNGYTSDRGTYYPLAPYRVLDTRSGQGAPAVKVASGQALRLQLTGQGGVPTDASTVVLNVTVTDPAGAGHVSIYPTDVARPTVSSLNYTPAWTGANSVTVKIGADGAVHLYNHGAAVHLIADVNGYYSKGRACCTGYMGGQYQPLSKPVRLADTREWGIGRVPAGYYINPAASWDGGINSKIRAFAVNITATDTTAPGFLTSWNGYGPGLPNTSTLNYAANSTVTNFAVVPTSPCADCGSATGWPSIGVYTNQDSHIIVDIVGYYDDSTLEGGLRFQPLVPSRIADTRTGQGWPSALGPATTATITAPDSVAGYDTWALATNITAVQPTTSTYLTVWPANWTGAGRPNTSNLNPAAGAIVPNAVQTMIGHGNTFNIYNNAGSTHVLVDAVGAFDLYPPSPEAGTSTQRRTSKAEPLNRPALPRPATTAVIHRFVQ